MAPTVMYFPSTSYKSSVRIPLNQELTNQTWAVAFLCFFIRPATKLSLPSMARFFPIIVACLSWRLKISAWDIFLDASPALLAWDVFPRFAALEIVDHFAFPQYF